MFFEIKICFFRTTLWLVSLRMVACSPTYAFTFLARAMSDASEPIVNGMAFPGVGFAPSTEQSTTSLRSRSTNGIKTMERGSMPWTLAVPAPRSSLS